MQKHTGGPGPAVSLRPVSTQRASEAIYEQIKDMITGGQLKPGDQLPSERTMMEQMKRSRPTIREALRMLEQSGFIRTTAGGSGAVIQRLDTQNLERSLEDLLQANRVTFAELAEYRLQNEAAVARWAALRRTEEDLAYLENVLAQAKAAIQDYNTFVSFDPQFHGALAKAAKNEVAYIITRVFSRVIMQILADKFRAQAEAEQLAMSHKIYGMHLDILEAVREADPDAAEVAMFRHMNAFREDLDKL